METLITPLRLPSHTDSNMKLTLMVRAFAVPIGRHCLLQLLGGMDS